MRPIRAEVASFAGAQVDAMDETFLAFRIENIAIGRIEDDVKSAATVVAASVYVLAMRDELLPRYPANQMPKLPTN